MTSPRVFKGHLPYEMMPCGLPSDTPEKYINVIRNLKNVAVSYFPYYPHYEWDNFTDMYNLNMETF